LAKNHRFRRLQNDTKRKSKVHTPVIEKGAFEADSVIKEIASRFSSRPFCLHGRSDNQHFSKDPPLAKLLIRGYHLDMILIAALVAACLQFVFLRQIGGDGSLLWN
jgi:hypothetical protein